MKTRLTNLTFLLLPFLGFAQTGPGGVGTTDGTSTLKIWIRTDNGVTTTGTSIDAITNSAGVSELDMSETGTQRPTLVAGAVNGYDEISFSGSNRIRTGLTLTTSNFVVNQATSFTVCRADVLAQNTCVYTTDPLVGSTRFSNHIPWSSTVYYDIGTCCGTSARIQVGSLASLTNYSVWSYDANPTSGKQLYRNGTLLQNRANTTSYTNHATHRFNIGGNTSGTGGYRGDVTEVIVFTTKVNSAQRIIIENYLAAKFGIASTGNNVYNEDDPAAGNYDHDVAGIGRVDASNLHNNARGTGVVQISNPSGLGNNEFYIWGHDNGDLEANNFTDIPGDVAARLARVWRGSESNTAGGSVDVGSVDISWDLNGLGTIVASDLRLLIDTDNDGLFSDETGITGASDDGGGIYSFSGVTGLEDNLRFTLGTINIWTTPLPVELVSFDVKLKSDKSAHITWETASEKDNDFFTIEKSRNGMEWTLFATVEGKGTSSTLASYELTDPKPYDGVTYYRLKQTDFSGDYVYHGIRSIFNAQSNVELMLYPNPASEYVVLEGLSDLSELPQVYDFSGKLCQDFVEMEVLGEYLVIHINDLADGVYIVKTKNDMLRFSKQGGS